MLDSPAAVQPLDVIPAAEVDPAIRGVREELAELEDQLSQLRRDAQILEGELAEAERAADRHEYAVELLDRAIGSALGAIRSEFREARASAAAEASALVESARMAADGLEADIESVVPSVPVTGPPVPRPAMTDVRVPDLTIVAPPRSPWAAPAAPPPHPFAAPPPAPPPPPPPPPPPFSPASVAPPPNGAPANAPPAGPSGPPPAPAEAAAGSQPPEQVDWAQYIRPAEDDHASTSLPPLAAPGASAVGAADKFVTFWNHDATQATPVRAGKPKLALADAVLPIVAVAIVAVIVLSWIG